MQRIQYNDTKLLSTKPDTHLKQTTDIQQKPTDNEASRLTLFEHLVISDVS